MVETILAKKENQNNCIPTFFIAGRSETEIIYQHSKGTGNILAEVLLSKWDDIEKIYSKLSISQIYPLKNQAFMLIGSRIFDIGLLGALSEDKTLLEPAPKRSSPEKPNARYYFWMVEGNLEHLGKYGQEAITLPWPNWYFLTFGQSWIQKDRNKVRDTFEKKCVEMINSGLLKSPESLAENLEVPFLNKDDSFLWGDLTNQLSKELLKTVKGQKDSFKEFYNTLKASTYASNSFGEFFCWYIHLAYVWAIDNLIERDLIIIPSKYFSSIIMYREGQEGLLVT